MEHGCGAVAGGGDTGGSQPPTGVVVGVCGGLLRWARPIMDTASDLNRASPYLSPPPRLGKRQRSVAELTFPQLIQAGGSLVAQAKPLVSAVQTVERSDTVHC